MRVSTWVGLGASPKAAAEYEGFDEAPVAEIVEDFHSPRPRRGVGVLDFRDALLMHGFTISSRAQRLP